MKKLFESAKSLFGRRNSESPETSDQNAEVAPSAINPPPAASPAPPTREASPVEPSRPAPVAPAPSAPVHAAPPPRPISQPAMQTPAPESALPKVRVPRPSESAPPPPAVEVKLDVATLNAAGGPAVQIVTRGSMTYGTCPHCGAQWNLRDRILHPRFRNPAVPRGLTCPACDQAVTLPPDFDLRKLH